MSVPQSTTFAWTISQLERETVDGFVYKIHYTINAADGVYTAGAYGAADMERPKKLLPFADLSEEICIGWVQAQLGEEKVQEIERALQLQLDEQHAPTKALGMPWAAPAR